VGESSATQRLELASLLHRIVAEQGELRAWAAQSYDDLRKRVESRISHIERALRQEHLPPGDDAVSKLAGELDNLKNDVMSKRVANEERRYVLEALTRVCRNQGYEVTTYSSESPTDDLRVDVNTWSHGIIRFRLQLDGIIKSDSAMIPDSCDVRFGDIETKLQSIGVKTAFRHADDDRPVRIQRGSKSLPDSGASQSARAGSS
jgi:hypothetical protein